MPGEMSGVELARVIQRDYSGIAVVLATGYSDQLGKLGVRPDFEILAKPYRMDDLAAALARALRQKDGSQEATNEPVHCLLADRHPSLGHGRTTPTALIHLANPLHEVAFYRRRWRAILGSRFSRKINSLRRASWRPKLGRRSTLGSSDAPS